MKAVLVSSPFDGCALRQLCCLCRCISDRLPDWAAHCGSTGHGYGSRALGRDREAARSCRGKAEGLSSGIRGEMSIRTSCRPSVLGSNEEETMRLMFGKEDANLLPQAQSEKQNQVLH